MVVEAADQAVKAGALGALGIDLKLFLAQLVNFAVVFFVMWKWVYVPLLKTMDERTKRIERGLSDAEAAAASKRMADEARAEIVAEARSESRRIIEAAAASAEAARAETVALAKADVERTVARGKERLAAEQAEILAAVRAEAADLVTAAAEKVLRAKLTAASDAELVRTALKDL